MRLWRGCAPCSSYGISRRRGYRISRIAVRSSSVGWPTMGWKLAAAVVKRAVISSGVMMVAAFDVVEARRRQRTQVATAAGGGGSKKGIEGAMKKSTIEVIKYSS